MTQTLLLRLPAPDSDDAEWLLLDDKGTATGPTQRGALSQVLPLASERRVIVLASATQVLFAEPEMPPGSGSRLAQETMQGDLGAGTERYNRDASELHWERVHSLFRRHLW